jgi:hypothetical protein
VQILSDQQEAPLDREVDESPESGKPADMVPAGPGSDMNPHSLAEIESIKVYYHH